jgi:hypothetical protein
MLQALMQLIELVFTKIRINLARGSCEAESMDQPDNGIWKIVKLCFPLLPTALFILGAEPANSKLKKPEVDPDRGTTGAVS